MYINLQEMRHLEILPTDDILRRLDIAAEHTHKARW